MHCQLWSDWESLQWVRTDWNLVPPKKALNFRQSSKLCHYQLSTYVVLTFSKHFSSKLINCPLVDGHISREKLLIVASTTWLKPQGHLEIIWWHSFQISAQWCPHGEHSNISHCLFRRYNHKIHKNKLSLHIVLSKILVSLQNTCVEYVLNVCINPIDLIYLLSK